MFLDASLMLKSFPNTLFSSFSDKSKWNYIGSIVDSTLWLHAASAQKLGRNEVWNLELGFQGLDNQLSFFFLMSPLYFLERTFISLLFLVTPFDRHQHAIITACVTSFISHLSVRPSSVEQRLISPQWCKCEQRCSF